MKKFKEFSNKKKSLRTYLSCIKTKVAKQFLKKKKLFLGGLKISSELKGLNEVWQSKTLIKFCYLTATEGYEVKIPTPFPV